MRIMDHPEVQFLPWVVVVTGRAMDGTLNLSYKP
jgi:hypothetical protein